MDLFVDIRRSLRSPQRTFELEVRFAVTEDLAVLYGPSGSGKSVTLLAIAGLLRPDAGMIRFGDTILFDSTAGVNVPARSRRIGYVFQDYALFPHRTIRQNVSAALVPLLGHHLQAADRRRVDELLDAFELSAIARSYPHQVSGGQRQRTALARALAAGPRLLLLDEPFNALDTELRARMRAEVLQVWQRFNVPTLLISHDAADVAAFGRQVIVVDDGRIMAPGAAPARAPFALMTSDCAPRQHADRDVQLSAPPP